MKEGDNLMKKLISVLLVVLLCFSMPVAFADTADAGTDSEMPAADVSIDPGTSELYSVKDRLAAMVRILDQFDTWEGCEMHSIRYAGDACNSEENLQWMNDLGNGDAFSQCIEFVSDFHSPKEAYGAWKADSEYTEWQWWLARSEGGDWELMTWGY